MNIGSARVDRVYRRGTGGYQGGADPRRLLPDPADYGPPQVFSEERRKADADGIVYPSVKHQGGNCIAVFWPNVVSVAQQADHYRYHWDGATVNFVRRISGDRAIYELKP